MSGTTVKDAVSCHREIHGEARKLDPDVEGHVEWMAERGACRVASEKFPLDAQRDERIAYAKDEVVRQLPKAEEVQAKRDERAAAFEQTVKKAAFFLVSPTAYLVNSLLQSDSADERVAQSD